VVGTEFCSNSELFWIQPSSSFIIMASSSTNSSSITSGFFESSLSSLFSPRLQRATEATTAAAARTTTTTTEAPEQQPQSASKGILPSSLYRTEHCRFYYSTSNQEARLFEQSLDIYKPIIMEEAEEDETGKEDKPVVVVALVVGSAWMGHRPLVYTGTSWWNSAGPKSIAQLGCVCVCIRHRGAFPLLCCVTTAPTTTTWLAFGKYHNNVLVVVLLPVLLAVVVTSWFREQGGTKGSTAAPALLVLCMMIMIFLAVVVCWTSLMMWMRRGSATFDDMLEDVAEAMVWIQNNPQHLRVVKRRRRRRQDEHQEHENDAASNSMLLLGGYSSGGHVAATLLQRPDIWQRHGLPLPQECLHGALFVSGVMAVHVDDAHNDDKMAAKNSSPIGMALTNLVKYMAFGPPQKQQQLLQNDDNNNNNNNALLPSPLHNVSNSPRIPHLLIGCAHELPFGLPWLDIFFRSRDYTRQVQQLLNVPARYIELPSSLRNNHWTILASNDLKRALVQGLAWLAEQQQQPQGDNKDDVTNMKMKNMVQQQNENTSSSELPDAILDDSSYSEE
jgi:hypothetical protein